LGHWITSHRKNKKYLNGFLEKSCRISRILNVRNKIIGEKYGKHNEFWKG